MMLTAPVLAGGVCSEKAVTMAKFRGAALATPVKPAQLRVMLPGGGVMTGAEVTVLRNALRAAVIACQMASRDEAGKGAEPAGIAAASTGSAPE